MEATTWIPDKIIFGSGYPVQPIGGMLNFYREHMSKEAFENAGTLDDILVDFV